MAIVLPKFHLTAAVPRPEDQKFGFDEFARSAMETYRNGYLPLPTASAREFGTFFSKENYAKLYKEVTRRAGYAPAEGDLFEVMQWAYSSVQPRSDEMDERRTHFDPNVTASYVAEMNSHVLDRIVEEVKQTNKLWDHYARYRNGPGQDFADDEDMHFGVDTRTRYHASRYDMTYWMP